MNILSSLEAEDDIVVDELFKSHGLAKLYDALRKAEDEIENKRQKLQANVADRYPTILKANSRLESMLTICDRLVANTGNAMLGPLGKLDLYRRVTPESFGVQRDPAQDENGLGDSLEFATVFLEIGDLPQTFWSLWRDLRIRDAFVFLCEIISKFKSIGPTKPRHQHILSTLRGQVSLSMGALQLRLVAYLIQHGFQNESASLDQLTESIAAVLMLSSSEAIRMETSKRRAPSVAGCIRLWFQSVISGIEADPGAARAAVLLQRTLIFARILETAEPDCIRMAAARIRDAIDGSVACDQHDDGSSTRITFKWPNGTAADNLLLEVSCCQLSCLQISEDSIGSLIEEEKEELRSGIDECILCFKRKYNVASGSDLPLALREASPKDLAELWNAMRDTSQSELARLLAETETLSLEQTISFDFMPSLKRAFDFALIYWIEKEVQCGITADVFSASPSGILKAWNKFAEKIRSALLASAYQRIDDGSVLPVEQAPPTVVPPVWKGEAESNTDWEVCWVAAPDVLLKLLQRILALSADLPPAVQQAFAEATQALLQVYPSLGGSTSSRPLAIGGTSVEGHLCGLWEAGMSSSDLAGKIPAVLKQLESRAVCCFETVLRQYLEKDMKEVYSKLLALATDTTTHIPETFLIATHSSEHVVADGAVSEDVGARFHLPAHADVLCLFRKVSRLSAQQSSAPLLLRAATAVLSEWAVEVTEALLGIPPASIEKGVPWQWLQLLFEAITLDHLLTGSSQKSSDVQKMSNSQDISSQVHRLEDHSLQNDPLARSLYQRNLRLTAKYYLGCRASLLHPFVVGRDPSHEATGLVLPGGISVKAPPAVLPPCVRLPMLPVPLHSEEVTARRTAGVEALLKSTAKDTSCSGEAPSEVLLTSGTGEPTAQLLAHGSGALQDSKRLLQGLLPEASGGIKNIFKGLGFSE